MGGTFGRDARLNNDASGASRSRLVGSIPFVLPNGGPQAGSYRLTEGRRSAARPHPFTRAPHPRASRRRCPAAAPRTGTDASTDPCPVARCSDPARHFVQSSQRVLGFISETTPNSSSAWNQWASEEPSGIHPPARSGMPATRLARTWPWNCLRLIADAERPIQIAVPLPFTVECMRATTARKSVSGLRLAPFLIRAPPSTPRARPLPAAVPDVGQLVLQLSQIASGDAPRRSLPWCRTG